MKLSYYPETDSLYVSLKPSPGTTTREIVPGFNIGFDATGEVVDFDIDEASKRVDLSTLDAKALPVRTERVDR